MDKRVKNILSELGTFVAVAGGLVSLALTINLAIQIFGTSNPFWIGIGILVGCLFNAAEIACFLRWKQSDKPGALVLGVLLALVSVSASVGALQISLERGAMESTDYTHKLKEIDLIDEQIEELQHTAREQKKINYITRSKQTSDNVSALLNSRKQAQIELNELRTEGAGLNAALYRAYANFLGVSVMNVAVWINIFVSLLIEIVFIYFTISQTQGLKITSLDIDGNGQLDALVDNIKHIIQQKAKYVKPDHNQKTIISAKPEKEKIFGFQPSTDVNVDTKSSTRGQLKTDPAVDVLDKKTVLELRQVVDRAGGKSDPVILHFWDNGESNKAKIGRLVRSVLDYGVSREYVRQVIKRERGA